MDSLHLKQVPKLVQQQRLILNQEQQLFLKLIQMNSLELKEYVEEQLVDNPILEEDQETKSDEQLDDLTIRDAELLQTLKELNIKSGNDDSLPFIKDNYYDRDSDFSWENNLCSELSLLEYVKWQLGSSNFTEQEKLIASLIIGNTDEDGYLNVDLQEILNEYIVHTNEIKNQTKLNHRSPTKNINNDTPINLDNIENILKQIQHTFDPVGVCARNLIECLNIQALNLGYRDNDLVLNIINQQLNNVSDKKYEEIAIIYKIDIQEVKKAVKIISSLEPKPGRPFYIKDTEKNISPDYHVYKVGNELQIQYQKHIPRLRISHYYQKLVNQSSTLTPDTKKYLKEKLLLAKRVIKGIEETESAITKVIRKIIDIQKDYFFYGNNFIKPLRLKDIADDKDVKVHESTVSRITSKRYISTPFGVIPLRSLFSRKIETKHGTYVSYERVRIIIQDLINNEDKINPYSDEDISKILEIRNIRLARRTVAKYRKALNIPSSSQRAGIFKEMKNGT